MSYITSNLFVQQSRSLVYNTGAFIADEAAWLIDPGIHPDEIAALAAAVRAHGATVQGIVLTHYHWDHILGPERLPGLPVVTHTDYPATLAAHREGTLQMIARWEQRHGRSRAVPFLPPQPDQALGDGATLALGAYELRLIHIPGHAADQIAIYAPESGTLWAADMLSDIEIPFVSHNLAAYITTLERLSELTINALVPGHGAPTTASAAIRARIDADRAYLAALYTTVEQAVRTGATIAATVTACAPLPINNPAMNAGMHQLNVESAYIELGGQADPDQVGWSRRDLIDE